MPVNYKLYPPNWRKVIVPRILKRANNCCEFCGLPNGTTVFSIPQKMRRKNKTVYRVTWVTVLPPECITPFKKVVVILTVAHLDHDRHNFKVCDDRLAALCQCCHLRYDALQKAAVRMRQIHFDWANNP